jgi:hypothetical protein
MSAVPTRTMKNPQDVEKAYKARFIFGAHYARDIYQG